MYLILLIILGNVYVFDNLTILGQSLCIWIILLF